MKCLLRLFSRLIPPCGLTAAGVPPLKNSPLKNDPLKKLVDMGYL